MSTWERFKKMLYGKFDDIDDTALKYIFGAFTITTILILVIVAPKIKETGIQLALILGGMFLLLYYSAALSEYIHTQRGDRQ